MAFFEPQQNPYAEAGQNTADRQTAWENIKDNLPALGLAFGLSMLARNNGSRNLGQLIGQAGSDALGAYGTWQKIQEAKQRQEMLDKERADEREYQRGQDAWRNDMAERKFGLEQAKMAQDMALARQRLGMEGARLALARQAAAHAQMTADEQRKYDETHKVVNGVPMVRLVREDGSFYWDTDPDRTIMDKDGNVVGYAGVEQKAPDFKDTLALSKDWSDKSKNYFTLGEQIDTLIANASQATGIGDAGMIYNIMKLFDPGSVVRDGEFQTAQLSSGALDRINTYYKQAVNGQRLTDEQRKDFVRLARDIYGKARKTQLKRNERYRNLAKVGGIDPSTFIYDPFDDVDKTIQAYLGSGPSPAQGTPHAAGGYGGRYIPGVTQRGGPGGNAAPGVAGRLRILN